MMFSPQNRRFSILVICASALCMATIAAVVLVETVSQQERDHTAATSRIVGYSGSLLMLLMVLIKSEDHERKASKARHALRNEMTTVAASAVEVVQKVEHIEQQAVEVVTKVENIERQTNGNLLEAVRKVADEIRVSERYQLMTDPAFHSELEPFLKRIVREVCDERYGKMGPPAPNVQT